MIYEARAFWEDAATEHATDRPGSLRYRAVRALETLLFRRADAGVVICEGMRRDLITRGISPARLHVVPNGVDTDWFQPQPHALAATKVARSEVITMSPVTAIP